MSTNPLTPRFPLYPTAFCTVAGQTRLRPGLSPYTSPWPGAFLTAPFFTDPPARTLYFATHPEELVDGLVCLVGDPQYAFLLYMLTAWDQATGTWSDVTASYRPH